MMVTVKILFNHILQNWLLFMEKSAYYLLLSVNKYSTFTFEIMYSNYYNLSHGSNKHTYKVLKKSDDKSSRIRDEDIGSMNRWTLNNLFFIHRLVVIIFPAVPTFYLLLLRERPILCPAVTTSSTWESGSIQWDWIAKSEYLERRYWWNFSSVVVEW